jgi:hypothetical protein
MRVFSVTYYAKQSNAKQSTQNKTSRNAEPALKGWFSGFGKEKHAKPCSQKGNLSRHFTSNQEIIPAEIIILT